MTLNPARTALIIVDLMPRIVDLNLGPHPGADVVTRNVRLATAARQSGATVVLVRVERPNITTQPPGSDFVPSLQPQDDDIVIVKRTVGAFHNTGLADRLHERDIDTLVMSGIATTMGVESTARAAADHGFTLFFVSDAMTGPTPAEHDHAVSTTFPHFGTVLDTDALLALL